MSYVTLLSLDITIQRVELHVVPFLSFIYLLNRLAFLSPPMFSSTSYLCGKFGEKIATLKLLLSHLKEIYDFETGSCFQDKQFIV